MQISIIDIEQYKTFITWYCFSAILSRPTPVLWSFSPEVQDPVEGESGRQGLAGSWFWKGLICTCTSWWSLWCVFLDVICSNLSSCVNWHEPSIRVSDFPKPGFGSARWPVWSCGFIWCHLPKPAGPPCVDVGSRGWRAALIVLHQPNPNPTTSAFYCQNNCPEPTIFFLLNLTLWRSAQNQSRHNRFKQNCVFVLFQF